MANPKPAPLLTLITGVSDVLSMPIIVMDPNGEGFGVVTGAKLDEASEAVVLTVERWHPE